MKRILITGITGYIGSHLARALLPDCAAYGLVREPLDVGLKQMLEIEEKICIKRSL